MSTIIRKQNKKERKKEILLIHILSTLGITSILQVKGLDDDFTNRVTVERESETQGEGDD